MIFIKKIKEMKSYIKEKKREGKIIGFVPTMGYLHPGHLSLIKKAKEDCEVVVVSIFVNPTQFGRGEDYEHYPRNLERDKKLCQEEGVDVIFAPEVKEMYPQGYSTFVEVEGMFSSILEGASRPGHFRGVTTVLTKLFHIISPDYSYFGEKDYQQALVVKKMVKDLSLNTQIFVLPTVREEDGLAVSSRNFYLNKEERKEAAILHKSLISAKEEVRKGERDPRYLISFMKNLIEKEPLAEIDYIAVVNPETLEEVKKINKKVLLILAVNIGKTRLIDNIKLKIR